MIGKNEVVNFFKKFRKGIVIGGVLLIAVALVGVVAARSYNYTKLEPSYVSTASHDTIIFEMPVENGEIIKDYSDTALKYNKTLKQWEAHKAVDIKANDDANVVACYDGEVVDVSTTYLKGTTVVIKHNEKLQTVYGSLNENILVKIGDKVVKGQIIGKVSNTAKNESEDGPHLHFEVLQDGKKVDPNLFLINSNK